MNRVGTIIAEQFGKEALAEYGLTIAMWRVLAALAAHGSLRQIDVAGFTSIETSTLSRLVSRLVRVGLVTRDRSAHSDREVAVKLSSKGDALVTRLIPLARQYETAAIAGLTREELLVLKRCLRRAYDNMKNRNMKNRNAARAEPTGPTRRGGPNDRLRENQERSARAKASPGFR